MNEEIQKVVYNRRIDIEQLFYDNPGVKVDCQAYINEGHPDCIACNSLYCEKGPCHFYKSKL